MNRYLHWTHTNSIVMGILLLSLFLNFYGLDWGLPYRETPASWIDPPEVDPSTVMSETTTFGVAVKTERLRVGSKHPWSYDVISPVGPLAAAKDGFSWGRWSKRAFTYPLAHYMVLAVFYAPYVAYLYLTGGFASAPTPGYPYGLADPVTSLTIFELIARSVGALMGTGIVLSSYLIVKEIFDKRAALFAALIVALSYTLIFYAHLPTVDIPYLFWFMWAFYSFFFLIKRQQTKYYLLFGVFSAIAFATKDQVYALLVLLALPVLWFHYRHHHPDEAFALDKFIKTLFHRELVYGLIGFVGTYAIVNNLILNFPRAVLHLQALQQFRNWDRYLDPTNPFDHFLLFRQTLYFLNHSLSLPLFIICLAGLLYCLYRWPKNSLLLFLPAAAYYVLFIVISLFYVHARHVIPIAIILSFFGGKLLADLTGLRQVPRWASYTLTGAVFVYSFLYAFTVGLGFVNETRYVAGQWLEENITPNAIIEAYDRRQLPYVLFDERYRVNLEKFGGNNYAVELKSRDPDYIILAEAVYRFNDDQPEVEWFPEALNRNEQLRALINEDLGYKLKAELKYTIDWLPGTRFPDIFKGYNPRLLIFERQ